MSALNIATRALTTNQAVLQVIGHNIANANTEGYTRQRVELQAVPGQQLGGGYFGKGVQIETVARIGYDAFLTRESNSTRSAAAAEATRYQYLQNVESLFPLGTGSLGTLLNNALNAWVDVASSPNDSTARQVVLDQFDALASRIRDTFERTQEIGASARLQADGVAKEVNRLAQAIASINDAIARVQGSGAPPNDLLDQRDRLIAQLGEQVQVTTLRADDGTLSVFVAGSLPLVLGSQASQLRIDRADLDGDRQLQVQFVQGSSVYDIPEPFLGAGKLKGLVDFVNDDLVQTQAELGRLALALSETVNRQQRSGLNARGEPGADLLNLSPLTGTAATGNAGNAQLAMTVADAAALKASDYVVTYASATTVTVQRASDGAYFDGTQWGTTATALALPQTFDGLSLAQTGGAAVAGDRFYLRPAADAARSLRVALASPAELAAASRLSMQAGVGNTGQAAFQGVSAVVDGAAWPSPPQAATLTFVAPGTFNITGTGWAPASVAYQPGQPMALTFTDGVNTVQVDLVLRGAPAAGDTFTLSEFPLNDPNVVRYNAGNAQTMLALRDRQMFDDSVTLSDGYVAVFSGLASRVNEAKTRSAFTQAQADDAERRRANQAGVNLDEEAARLLQFQQAYQASAKYLQTVQSIFDTLIATFR